MGAEQSIPWAPSSTGVLESTHKSIYEKAIAAGNDSPTASDRTNSDSSACEDGEGAASTKGGSAASPAAARPESERPAEYLALASDRDAPEPTEEEEQADDEERDQPSPSLPASRLSPTGADTLTPPTDRLSPSARSHRSNISMRSARDFVRKNLPTFAAPAFATSSRASPAILAKQSLISGVVTRLSDIHAADGATDAPDDAPKVPAPPAAWKTAPTTPVKRWPTVTAATGTSEHSSTRVLARYDTVTKTLHGVGTEIVRAEPTSKYRGAADVWGDEEEEEVVGGQLEA